MNLAEFEETITFAGQCIMAAFSALDNAVVIDSPRVSFLTILIGFLAFYLILDRILNYMHGEDE